MINIYLLLFAVSCVLSGLDAVSIEVFGIGDCDKPVDGDIKIDVDLKSDSPKSANMAIDLPYDIEGQDAFHMDVHQMMDDGQWSMYEKDIDGDICTYVDEFLLEAWKKLKKNADPEISDECSIPKGTYSWNEFQLEPTDIVVPGGMIGRFMLDISLIKDDDTVLCKSVELEVKN